MSTKLDQQQSESDTMASNTDSMDEDILVIVTLIIFNGIYLPLSIYQIYRLYKCTYRKINPIESLRKRQTGLSLICTIAYAVQFICLSVWSIVYTDWFSKEIEQKIVFVAEFTHLLMQLIISFFIVLRFWLLHYSVKYEMISGNHHWKKIINPDYQIEERKQKFNGPYRSAANGPSGGHNQISNTEWIMANRNKWGNRKFLLKTGGVVFVLFFIAICAAQTLHTFYGDESDIKGTFELVRTISSMITYGIFLLIWSLMLAIYCRTPSFYDHIYVKKELAHLFHIMVGFFFVYIIFAVLFGFSNDDVYDETYFPEILLLFHCVALGNIIAIHVFTYLPLSNLQKFEQSGLKRNKTQTKSMLNLTLKKLSLNNNDSTRTEDVMMNHYSQSLHLEDCLKNNFGFSAFMKHLAHEFSTEVLLSVTEFTMYKKYLYDNVLNMVGFADRDRNMHLNEEAAKINQDDDPNADLETAPVPTLAQMSVDQTMASPQSTNLSPPQTQPRHKQSDIYSDAPFLALPFDKIPKSSIVYDEEKSNLQKAYLLYKKYIQTGAEWEINIAGGLRSTYRQRFDNKEKWLSTIGRQMDIGDLAEIFDKCNDINLGLMSHSFIRFKRTQEWKHVVLQITSKQSIDFNPEEFDEFRE